MSSKRRHGVADSQPPGIDARGGTSKPSDVFVTDRSGLDESAWADALELCMRQEIALLAVLRIQTRHARLRERIDTIERDSASRSGADAKRCSRGQSEDLANTRAAAACDCTLAICDRCDASADKCEPIACARPTAD